MDFTAYNKRMNVLLGWVAINHECSSEEISRTERKSTRQIEQLSAEKNLFLETGWYRPAIRRIPVTK